MLSLGSRNRSSLSLIAALLIGALGLATGCENSGSSAPANGSSGAASTSARTPTSNGTTTPGASSYNVITITRVVRSNFDPNTMLETLGQNAEIGTNCPTVDACRCVFNWIESSGVVREMETTPLMTETNLARCSFYTVSNNVGYFDVKLRVLAANQFSNSVRVYMPVTNPDLDPALASNYLPVYRYQCRDLLDTNVNTQKYRSNLLDPVLWQMSLVFNLYSTKIADDYGARSPAGSSGGVKGYECPVIPNDRSEDPVYDMRLFSVDPIDLNNPNGPTPAPGLGDNTIFPPSDNVGILAANCPTGAEANCEKYRANRHDFYVATFRSGIFREPVCMLHRISNIKNRTLECALPPDAASGPIRLTSPSLQTTGKDIIGFAAIPDANQRCPDPSVVRIPPGKKWAKVWQFRTSRAPRTIQDVTNPNDIGDLFCTTRELECKSRDYRPNAVGPPATTLNVASVCYNTKSPSGSRLGAVLGATIGGSFSSPGFGNCDQDGNVGDGRGDRVDGNYTIAGAAMDQTLPCMNPSATNPYNCCRELNEWESGAQKAGVYPANYTPGGEWCNPGLIGSHDASSRNILSHTGPGVNVGLAQDVWLMGNGSRRACIEADTDANGRIWTDNFPPANPAPYEMYPRPIDSDAVYDVVYAVTPENVTIEQMQNRETGPIARRYTPYRLKPNSTDVVQFDLWSGSSNSGTYLDRLSRFPLCVLQDTQKGSFEVDAP